MTIRCVSVLVVALAAAAIGAEPSDPQNVNVVVNSLGMKLMRIGPGEFSMGSASGGDWDERPAHPVKIARPFCLGVTEVTNAQYEQFDPQHKRLRGKQGFSSGDDEAAVFVSWHDAVRFCEWLGRKENKPYRLPTEAEWEYACRAGTTTAYHTGDALPDEFHKNAKMSWYPSREAKDEVVSLAVGRTPPNAWGLCDMHGNVEEWCLDWYGPYELLRNSDRPSPTTDPVGRAEGDFRVTRGGSHGTTLEYLRSANRSGTLPEDASWLIGFRVAQAEMPAARPLPLPPPPLWARDVKQEAARATDPPPAQASSAPGAVRPFFRGPRPYVLVPPEADGPMFAKHNHDPAIVECPNGDLLAIWYSCRTEPGRELAILASRLRAGAEAWEPATPFWDAPDRNDHAPAMWFDGRQTLYHFNGLSAAATWGNLAVVLRTSTDNGATWSPARLIMPEHTIRHQPVESVLRTRDGAIVLACDALPGGQGGTALHFSRDEGRSWSDPGGKIMGIHAPVVELSDGRLLAFGRGEQIERTMPQSISADQGKTWTSAASPFPPLAGGQRAVLLRLREGPILLVSFAKQVEFRDAAGQQRKGSGMFAAISEDEGQTWQVRRLITDDGPPRTVDGGGNTGKFTLGPDSAEPRGYLSICQAADGRIHLIGSKQHYTFNLAWLKTPPPAARAAAAPPAAALRVEQSDSSAMVVGRADGGPLLAYRFGGVPFKPYVRQLFTPGGAQVLRDAPTDHKHHHALMFAVKIDGVDFWAETPQCGTQAQRKLTVAAAPASATPQSGTVPFGPAEFTAQLDWLAPDKTVLAQEERTLRVEPGSDGDPPILTWTARLSPAAGKETMTLAGSHYFGLGVRFAETMDRDGKFLTPDGKLGDVVRGAERLTPAAWCAYAAAADGRPVTVAVFDHPNNPRHPARMFTMSGPFAYLAATLNLWKEPLEVKAGAPLVLRYGVVAWDGQPDAAKIAAAYKRWAGIR